MRADFAGARWWKFDFHTHTPFSWDTYWHARIGQTDAVTPEQWLRRFMDAGIDCVAVTDHNGGGWIDELKSKYEDMERENTLGFRQLVLFPGVEISVNGGFHVLALFDVDSAGAHITGVLGALDYNGQQGDPDACTTSSLADAIPKLAEAGGLVIPAHADQAKGLLEVRQDAPQRAVVDANTLKQILGSRLLIAMEIVSPGTPLPQLYRDSKVAWTAVVGSDCHNFQGGPQPGDRFTWVKMGVPSLEGVRLALLDGSPLSVQRSDQTTGDPNQRATLVLEEIVVRDARYAGRGEPLRVRFSPWLSCLIGGRGSGKSTVIEMLRLGLRRHDDLPKALRPAFERFARVPESRHAEGALTPDTEIAILLRKDSARFRVTWRQSGQGSVIEEQQADGGWAEAAGDVPSRFPARIFSQKHVFTLSEDPNALLQLIDEAPQVARPEWERSFRETEARFLRLRGECRELAARLADRARIEGELADVGRQLAVFEAGGHRDLLVRFQRSRRQRRALDDRAEELAQSTAQLRAAASSLAPADIREEDFDEVDAAQRAGLELLREAATRQQELSAAVSDLATRLAEYRAEWTERRNRSAWSDREGEIAAAYHELVPRLRAEGIQDPTTYGALVQRRQGLERQVAEMESLRRRIEELEIQSAQALEALSRLRLDLSRRRSEFLENVLPQNAYVRMAVVPFGAEASAAETTFRSHLGREDDRLAEDILSKDGERGILVELYDRLPASPDRGESAATRIDALKQRLLRCAGGGEIEGWSKWFHNHLRGLRADQVDRLLLWWPDDALRVEYRRASDFSPIEQGSPGQKSAAILAFLLSYGDEPIVLDQPEDDLDNHLIYDLIVRQVRENKRQRQVIVATHNANIVVNGDAEMVIAMDHRGGQCRLIEEGTGCLQERGVRDEILRVMEGGREAFDQRYRRILEGKDRV